jgi:hypothetical protein
MAKSKKTPKPKRPDQDEIFQRFIDRLMGAIRTFEEETKAAAVEKPPVKVDKPKRKR